MHTQPPPAKQLEKFPGRYITSRLL